MATLPAYARTAPIPRPVLEAVLCRLDVDRHLVDLLDRVRDRNLGLPVWAGRSLLLLSPRYVRRVLGGSDILYSPDTDRNRTAYAALAPGLVTLARDRTRMLRRDATESMLDTKNPGSAMAGRFAATAADEIDAMLDGPVRTGILQWSDLRSAFDRAGRRCVLGDAARDDLTVTALVTRLSRRPNRHGRRRAEQWKSELDERIARYADDPHPSSLLGRIADGPSDGDLLDQVPYWLLSTSYVAPIAAHALALLATHPRDFARVMEELADAERHHGAATPEAIAAQPYLQAAITEAARLWPSVPTVSRVTTRPVSWESVPVEPGTNLVVDLRYQARSRRGGSYANRFAPHQWLDGSLDADWTILPFGAGRGGCAGAMLGVHLAVAGASTILRRCFLRAIAPTWAPDRPLPVTHSPADVRFAVASRPEAALSGASITSETILGETDD
ncbi:cytochrome P450 [Stackebrandtia soli]|uniref:cytochrome P450 n=1 Tax=Stackebrandtia soli TaxID=1892856 RepID=UPI0039E7A99E